VCGALIVYGLSWSEIVVVEEMGEFGGMGKRVRWAIFGWIGWGGVLIKRDREVIGCYVSMDG